MAVGGATLSRGAGRISRRLDRLGEKQFALLVSIPGLLLIALIVLPPTLAVFGLSLYRIEFAKDDVVRFVGLTNYTVRLPADREVLEAIPRTLFFAALTTAVTLPLALVTALVLNRTVPRPEPVLPGGPGALGHRVRWSRACSSSSCSTPTSAS